MSRAPPSAQGPNSGWTCCCHAWVSSAGELPAAAVEKAMGLLERHFRAWSALLAFNSRKVPLAILTLTPNCQTDQTPCPERSDRKIKANLLLKGLIC